MLHKWNKHKEEGGGGGGENTSVAERVHGGRYLGKIFLPDQVLGDGSLEGQSVVFYK